MSTISQVGLLERHVTGKDERRISVAGLAAGVHAAEDLIFSLDAAGQVMWVVSAICDHVHGRLQLCDAGRTARCPLHGWELDTQSLAYRNVALQKPQLPFSQEGDVLACAMDDYSLVLPQNLQSAEAMRAEVRFISHACVAIDVGGVRIVTDPWFFGPCFIAGWWHAFPPKSDALEILNSADLVYISHNHPDHMHIETLAHVRKDMLIVVPDYPSQSTVRPIREMGFVNVEAVAFNSVFQVDGSPVHFSVLQAGDFRDDSGLFLSAGDFSCLLSVDSNRLNNFVLPQNVDLLMTAFSGGASGFPVCFDVVPENRKDQVVARNKGAAAGQAMEYVRKVKPKLYVPYAGFFTELAPRDSDIRKRNKKNSSTEVVALAERQLEGVRAHDPLRADQMIFEGGSVHFSRVDLPRLYEPTSAYAQKYIEQLKAGVGTYSLDVISRYFKRADFRDDLVIYLFPTDDEFDLVSSEIATRVDFSGATPVVTQYDTGALKADYETASTDDKRHLMIRVRKDAFWRVIEDRLPWEDLSIGFQCRIDRKPDVYNSDFWFHFTNVHIGDGALAEMVQEETSATG